MLEIPFHPFTTTSRGLPVEVGRSWIFASSELDRNARCEPSGDKLHSVNGSVCEGPMRFPVRTSKRNVSEEVFPLLMLYMHTADGERAHWTFEMATSLSTRRGVPPFIGIAKIEEGASRRPNSGVEIFVVSVEIYRTSDPSGVSLGCLSCSSLLPKISGEGSSMCCLKISHVPFRSEEKRTALLSSVQQSAQLSFSSSVSLRFRSKCVPFTASVPMKTLGPQLPLRIVTTFPSKLPDRLCTQPGPCEIRLDEPEILG
jgi:hypothetical protein